MPTSKINEIQELKVEGEIINFIFKVLFLIFFQKVVQEFEQIIYCTHQSTARTLKSNYNLIKTDIVLKLYKHNIKIRRKKKVQLNAISSNTDW